MNPIKLPGLMDAAPGEKQDTVIPVRDGFPSVFIFALGLPLDTPIPEVTVQILNGTNKRCVWEDFLGSVVIRINRDVVNDLAIRIDWESLGLLRGDYEVQITTKDQTLRFFASVI